MGLWGLKEFHELLEYMRMCGQNQHACCSYSVSICRRIIMEVFLEDFQVRWSIVEEV